MSVCLSDLSNLSCFPKTLGSEPQSSNVDEGSVVGAIAIYIIAIGVVGGAAVYGLMKWFKKYKLQFLLRINLLAFTSANLMNILSSFRIVPPEHFDFYCRILWYFSGLGSLVMFPVRYYWKLPIDIRKRLKTPKKKILYMKIDDLPPVYPNSWIPVLEADRLHRGEIKGVHALGNKFCIFRGEESGEAYVLNAYCPHLGADMTQGGKVRGNCVECPFHGWTTSGVDGQCTPRSKGDKNNKNIQPIEFSQEILPENEEDTKNEQVDSKDIVKMASSEEIVEVSKELKKKKETPARSAKAKKWISCEVNKWIYVWHHAEDDEDIWEMPRIEPVCNGEWVYRGRTEHEVNCHIQEIPENGADFNHLNQLHSTNVFMGNNFMDATSWLNILNHHWEPRWKKDDNYRHIARITLKQTTTLFGRKLPFKMGDLDLEIEQIGAATVHLHINSSFGKAVLLQNIIPEGPLFMRVIHHLYTEPSFPAFPAELLLRSEAIMFERNVSELEFKEYTLRSEHRKEQCSDCPIYERRRWYLDTFTSQNSSNVRKERENTFDF